MPEKLCPEVETTEALALRQALPAALAAWWE